MRVFTTAFVAWLIFNTMLPADEIKNSFDKEIKPLITKFCVDCHNPDNMESGIKVTHLDGNLKGRSLFLWEEIAEQLESEAMPPEDETQPSPEQRKLITDWIERAIRTAKSKPDEKNGSIRRLTVSQYKNSLNELLGIKEDFTKILPPDSISKDGFLNNSSDMILSPLLIEAYFDVAQKALDSVIVDEKAKPTIQNFRLELGKDINANPIREKLILGALSMLLPSRDFVVTQPKPKKDFPFEPFAMRTKFRFHEGYAGNSTVRGWREYDSIYHNVFACVRGNGGYPKGLPYELIEQGLLLRPAIPSAELFGVESTYGPKSNFKISLRDLPNHGNFRVKVTAAKYDDGLLLERGAREYETNADSLVVNNPSAPSNLKVNKAGAYRAQVYFKSETPVKPDGSRLAEGQIGKWDFTEPQLAKGKLESGAKVVDTPFGKGLRLNGKASSYSQQRPKSQGNSFNIGKGEFTIAAWIRPEKLRQAGIFSLGGYGYAHGFVFDMPNQKGILRIETANKQNQANGTVQSAMGIIRAGKWQHVAAVVKRGDNQTELFVNGFSVAKGTINDADLDNPETTLHIGRVENANVFKGDIDEVYFFNRALEKPELEALIEPGRKLAEPPNKDVGQKLTLRIDDRSFTGNLNQPAFIDLRLNSGTTIISTKYSGKTALDKVVFVPLPKNSDEQNRFNRFASRTPNLGVHVGLRRDCGSTLTRVGDPVPIENTNLANYFFEGAINNYPSPDVEKGNINYLAGIREIGVRSEYTDGRDMPRMLVRSIEFEGPYYETWPPKAHQNIFIESASKSDSQSKLQSNPQKYAKEIIANFATRAFRRPINDEELTAITKVFKDSFADSGDFVESIKDSLLIVLTSPQFLFMLEDSATPKPEPIDEFELASKLSYFLWNAPPDQQTLDLAKSKNLKQSIDQEIDRLIDSDRFSAFVDEFAKQWLQLEKLSTVETDRRRFPKLTRDTKVHLAKEPARYLEHLLRTDAPIRELIQSDYIVANEVTAAYYDLADKVETGFRYTKVPHHNDNLGGILTNAGILASLSDGRESNPIKRGAWFSRKIIAKPPQDPPPNVPELAEENEHLSLRERLEQHRNQKGCLKCHSGIDPWGIPFEQFDAGGLSKKNRKSYDPRSKLPDDTNVANLNELKNYLVTRQQQQVVFSFLKHLTVYAIGRPLTYNEIEFLKKESLQLKADGYRMRQLIHFVVNSPMFMEK